jgi:hypothetical protein
MFTQPHIQWSQWVLSDRIKRAGYVARGWGGGDEYWGRLFRNSPTFEGGSGRVSKAASWKWQRTAFEHKHKTCALQDITKTEHTPSVPAQSIRRTTPTCQLLHKCKSPGCSCATCMTALTQPLFAVKTAHIYCRNVCQILIKLLHVALTQRLSNPHQAPPHCSNPVFLKLLSANGCQGVRETKMRNGGRVLLAVRNLYVLV